MVGRLIQQIHRGLLRQQRRDGHAALLTAGQGIGAPRRKTRHVHGGERRARQFLVLRRLPLPQRQVRMAADQHRLERGADEGILQILRQEADPQRDRAAAQLRERRAGEHHRAAGRRAQACERVQREGLAGTVAAQDRHDLARRELHRQIAHQRPRAGLHTDGCCGEAPRLRQCVQRISSAVSGPITTRRRLAGISHSCADSARLPAMTSASSWG